MILGFGKSASCVPLLFLVIVLIAFTAGCQFVGLRAPVAGGQVQLDPKTFDGVWESDGNWLITRAIGGAPGRFEAYYLGQGTEGVDQIRLEGVITVRSGKFIISGKTSPDAKSPFSGLDQAFFNSWWFLLLEGAGAKELNLRSPSISEPGTRSDGKTLREWIKSGAIAGTVVMIDGKESPFVIVDQYEDLEKAFPSLWSADEAKRKVFRRVHKLPSLNTPSTESSPVKPDPDDEEPVMDQTSQPSTPVAEPGGSSALAAADTQSASTNSLPQSIEDAVREVQRFVKRHGFDSQSVNGNWDSWTENATDVAISNLQKEGPRLLWNDGWDGGSNGSNWTGFSLHIKERFLRMNNEMDGLKRFIAAIEYLRQSGVYRDLPSCGLRHTQAIDQEVTWLSFLNGFFREWGDEIHCWGDSQCQRRSRMLMEHTVIEHPMRMIIPNVIGALICPFVLVPIAIWIWARKSPPSEAFVIAGIADVVESLIGVAGELSTHGTLLSGFPAWLGTTIAMAVLTGAMAAWRQSKSGK